MSTLMDPTEIEDHTFNFSQVLTAGETVTAATVTVSPAGLTLAPAGRPTTIESPRVVAWVTGGTELETYALKCSATTSGGRQYVETRYIRVLTR